MKLTTQDLLNKLQAASAKAPVGSLWLHFKGGVYVVTGHAVETEDMNTVIQYRRVGGPDFNAIDEANIVFSRPVNSWFGRGQLRDHDSVRHVDRFTRVP